jgi:uncharacterized membrane protein
VSLSGRDAGSTVAAAGSLGDTSTGLRPRLAAVLAYSAWWITGGLFLLLEPENAFVRFHARQAVVVLGAVWLLGIGLWAASFLAVFVSPRVFRAAALLSHAVWLAGVAVWLVCLVQAGRGRWWRVPLTRGRLTGARGPGPA